MKFRSAPFCSKLFLFIFFISQLYITPGHAQKNVHHYGILSGEAPETQVGITGQKQLPGPKVQKTLDTAEQQKKEAARHEDVSETGPEATGAVGDRPSALEEEYPGGKEMQGVARGREGKEEVAGTEEKIGGDLESLMEVFEQKGTPTGLEPVKVLAIINTDEYGNKITYPYTLCMDTEAKELFVIGSGLKGEPAIFIFDKNYYPAAVLGSGRGIMNPKGVIVDKSGRIYVVWIDTAKVDSSSRSRLTVFNAAFFKIWEFDFSELPEAAYFDIQQIALGDNGSTIYLAGYSLLEEGGMKGVLVLDGEGNFRRWLVPLKGKRGYSVGSDPLDRQAMRVTDVVVDSSNRLYVLCPEDGKVFVLDNEGNLLFTFGTKGGNEGKLSRAVSLAVDVKRQVIYVADYMRHTVLLYKYDGTYLFEIGGLGSGPGWFSYPNHLGVDWDSNLIVADLYNHRIQVLNVP